jgi:hypothetical protein
MQSRLETILMTSVSSYLSRFCSWAFGWFLTPASEGFRKLCHDINILFFDTYEELEGYDDNRMMMLGLDVGAVNDNDKYWEYNTRTDRRRNRRGF